MEKESLYPFIFNGKKYTEKNVDEKFAAFYHSVDSLTRDGGVYAYDQMLVFPDGKICHERDFRINKFEKTKTK
jgi:hypothetical protein